jgi:hypothetical protein
VIPFCDFGVREKGVVAADDAGWETTSNGMVSWVETFIITRWVETFYYYPLGSIRIASCSIVLYRLLRCSSQTARILTLVECIPNWYEFIISANDECCVVEIVIYNACICPCPIRIEECERSV